MATVTRYVNPSSSGGNGTTTALSGANAAYASLNAAITSEKTAFNGGSDAYKIVCAGGADGTLVGTIDWSTTVTKTLLITTDDVNGNKHDGTYNSGYYLNIDTSDNGDCFNIAADYVTIEGIEIDFNNYGTNKFAISIATGTTNFLLKDCLLHQDSKTVGGLTGIGNVIGNETYEITCENCVFDGFSKTGARIKGSTGFPGITATFTNCVFANCGKAGDSESGGIWTTWNNYGSYSLTINNCVAVTTTNGSDYDVNGSATVSGANNFASDTSGVGTSPTNSIVVANNFTNAAAGDFTVVNSSADIYEGGSSGTATSADIIGTTRKATPDAGAFELAAAGTSVECAVPAGSLTISGQTPAGFISESTESSVAAGSLTISGQTPSGFISESTESSVLAGSLTISGQTPAAFISESTEASIPAGSLTITGNAPTGNIISPGIQASIPRDPLFIEAYAPRAQISESTVGVGMPFKKKVWHGPKAAPEQRLRFKPKKKPRDVDPKRVEELRIKAYKMLVPRRVSLPEVFNPLVMQPEIQTGPMWQEDNQVDMLPPAPERQARPIEVPTPSGSVQSIEQLAITVVEYLETLDE